MCVCERERVRVFERESACVCKCYCEAETAKFGKSEAMFADPKKKIEAQTRKGFL